MDWDDGKFLLINQNFFSKLFKLSNLFFFFFFCNQGPVAPPTKRPNKDPMPSHRPSPEQYAAMISAAAAAGQPLPRHHVCV
jgi:hypothetical protein